VSELGYLVSKALEEEAGDVPLKDRMRLTDRLVADVEALKAAKLFDRLVSDICNAIHGACVRETYPGEDPEHGPYLHKQTADGVAHVLLGLDWITRHDIPSDVVEAEIHDITCRGWTGTCEACGRSK
jgi:hypothetical protein